MTTEQRRRRTEEGWVAVEMPVAICLLLIPIACLIAVLPTWLERQSIARTAARESARTIARSNDVESGRTAANRAVAEIAANNGLDPTQLRPTYTGNISRGGQITSDVTVDIPLVIVPSGRDAS